MVGIPLGIPQSMLEALPENRCKVSLLQGFRATLTPLPHPAAPLTPRQISASNSAPQLNEYKVSISASLDLLELRKSLAAQEIADIDDRIALLQNKREIVFDRVANLEQEEMLLESKLPDIEARLQYLQLNPPATTPAPGLKVVTTGNNVNGDSTTVTTPVSSDREGDDYVNVNSFLSQSIYGKLNSQDPLNNDQKFTKRSIPSRKTNPTLQKYYESGANISTFRGHQDSITCFDFDLPFGTLVSASLDNTVKIWDMSRQKCLGFLEGHNSSVLCLQMEDNIVVTGSVDATLRLWDLTKVDQVQPSISTDISTTYSDETQLQDEPFFDTLNEEDEELDDSNGCVHVFESHVGEVTALNFNNYTLVSGSSDKTIRQWDIQTGRCYQTLDVLWALSRSHMPGTAIDNNLSSSVNMNSSWGMGSHIDSPMNDDNNNHKPTFIGALQCFDAALASGTSDGIVRLWDLRTGQVHRSLTGHTAAITTLQFDDKHLITGGFDHTIRIWDLRTGSIIDAFAYNSPIINLQFDSSKIVCSNMENTVKIYDRNNERHWSCGPGVDENNANASIVEYTRYKEGYLVEGRADGMIGSWAC